jgi:hypothetical protein
MVVILVHWLITKGRENDFVDGGDKCQFPMELVYIGKFQQS